MMVKQRIEVFSSGCPVCEEAIALVRRLASDRCEVAVLNMHDPQIAEQAQALGVKSVPAVAIDGRLAPCCAGRGIRESSLRAAGLQ